MLARGRVGQGGSPEPVQLIAAPERKQGGKAGEGGRGGQQAIASEHDFASFSTFGRYTHG